MGSDSGFIYKLYGFDYIRELELLREAGFHPLEVIRAATLTGAEALGAADGHRHGGARQARRPRGASRRTRWPDLKVLYGTGAHPAERRRTSWCASAACSYTIKDGIVYDAKKLLADVRRMVREAKEKDGRPVLYQPGMET